MKIAFLNPWRNAAENQVFESMAIAAARIGHELVQCSNSMQIAAAAPEFVLAMASPQPKLNDLPHYGIIHEPRDLFLTERNRYNGVLTRDGYLTLADSLAGFIRDLTFAVGRPQEPGFFFTTCQRQDLTTDVLGLAAARRLKITYFGTNWDGGRAEVIRNLSQHDGVTVFGPEDAWRDLPAKSRGGTLPFDGSSVQRAYTERGIGLCLLSEGHYRDDVMSNRLFEIASVGAIAICPDIPWVRKHFGDAVYYIDQWLPRRQLVQQILLRQREIEADPQAAAEKARKAREIFEERFAAEVLLANTVRYHQEVSTKRAAVLAEAAGTAPLISVVIRCGSRPIEMVKRAMESVAEQSYGRFELILVRHAPIDLGLIEREPIHGIESVRLIEVAADSRRSSLWAGLAAVKGDYFALLAEDAWLFSDHFEKLFYPFAGVPKRAFFAYSGAVRHDAAPRGKDDRDCRELTHFGITDAENLVGASGGLTPNCFVASTDLLVRVRIPEPPTPMAEDTYLTLGLLDAVDNPQFSYAATAVYEGGCDGSDRFDQEVAAQVRMHARYRPRLNVADGFAALTKFWKQRPERDRFSELPNLALSLRKGKLPVLSVLPAELTERVAVSINVGKSRMHAGSKVVDADKGDCVVETPTQPWAYGIELALTLSKGRKGAGLICLNATVTRGPVGIGVLNPGETDFVFRTPLYESEEVQVVHLPVADLGAIGRVVVQNWETEGVGEVRVQGIEVVTEFDERV